MSVDLVICNAKAYIDKQIVNCSFAINEGRILKIGKEATMPKAETKIDLKNLLVLPGLIDVHVHLRDEGKAYKEDFYSGTAAAAAGGITTVLDMPNNNPVTMNVAALKNRMKKAEKKILVNVGFYSEFPKKNSEIEKIIAEDAVAFKLFMAEQVGGLNIDDDDDLLEAFRIATKMKVPIAIHAEDKLTLKEAEHKFKRANCNDIDAFLKAHSEGVEAKAVKRVLNLVKQVGTHVHFCHVSTEDGLNAIVDEKKKAVPITCETTPHHLLISSDELKRIGTLALTMPPVREKQHLIALWNGIKNGWIDIVASDHAPHALEEKKAGTVWDVKVGVPGLETTLPLMLTEVNRGRLSIAEIASLMAERPAEVFKLTNKGYLKEGYSADLTVIDLNKKYRIDASKFHSKAKYSPFDKWAVEGKPVKTFVNGQLVMEDEEIIANPGSGQIIRRE